MEKINIALDSYLQLMTKMNEEGHSSFYSTSGFNSIDEETNGYFKGELVVVAGRPGMGVSTFLMESAIGIANQQHNIGYISFGVQKRILESRFFNILSGVDSSDLLKMSVDTIELSKLQEASKRANIPVYLHFPETSYVEDLETQLEEQIKEHDLKYIIIDDIQSITCYEKRNMRSRFDEINEIMRKLKALTNRHQIIMIAASRLSRKVEESTDKRPMICHIRESGMIEDLADKVILLYRPEYYRITEDANGNSMLGMMEVIIAKNNSGRLGSINMQAAMMNGCFRIKEWNIIYDENWQSRLEQLINRQNNPDNDVPF